MFWILAPSTIEFVTLALADQEAFLLHQWIKSYFKPEEHQFSLLNPPQLQKWKVLQHLLWGEALHQLSGVLNKLESRHFPPRTDASLSWLHSNNELTEAITWNQRCWFLCRALASDALWFCPTGRGTEGHPARPLALECFCPLTMNAAVPYRHPVLRWSFYKALA